MNKKTSSAMILLGLIIVGVAVFYLVQRDASVPQTEEEALRQAAEYQPEACAMVVTPAVHEATGAKYTFSSGCIPQGWKPSQ